MFQTNTVTQKTNGVIKCKNVFGSHKKISTFGTTLDLLVCFNSCETNMSRFIIKVIKQ